MDSEQVFYACSLLLEIGAIFIVFRMICRSRISRKTMPSLRKLGQKLSANPEIKGEASIQLDLLRCRVACCLYHMILLLVTFRCLLGQIMLLRGNQRTLTEFDFGFWILGAFSLLVSLRPSIVTPKSLDARQPTQQMHFNVYLSNDYNVHIIYI